MQGLWESVKPGSEELGEYGGSLAGDRLPLTKRQARQLRVRRGLGEGIRTRMRRRRDLPRLPAVWPAIAWRIVGLVLFLAALAFIAYESAQETSGDTAGVRDSVMATIAKPAVAIPVALLLVLGIANFLRRLWYEWLAITPGPIFVHELSVAPDLSDVDVAHLTTAFRRRLMQMRLNAPAPVPGAIPAQDFLSVLDHERLDAKNILGSAVSILRAAVPTHAYEVSVTLTKTPADAPAASRCGVTAQVTRLPSEATPVETAWAYSWDEAIIQAADRVTAVVLPRTTLSNRSPWAGWRRYPMPSLLVHHYEKAQELTGRRRYDEALDHYFQALDLDPKNVDLRLHKGFVEEKLGLYLDAVATYAAARRIAEDTSPRLYHRRARRNRTAEGSIARYRLAVLLAGVKFSHQWRKPDENSLRDKQRQFLRRRLAPELVGLLKENKLVRSVESVNEGSSWRYGRDEIGRLLNERGTKRLADEDDSGYYELRRVLARLARIELAEVRHELTRHRRLRPGSLTPLSVDLTVRWLDLRSTYVEHRLIELTERGGSGGLTPLESHGRAEPSRLLAWDPHPELTLPGTAPPFQTWTEEYNAASLFALPLLIDPPHRPDPDDEARRDELAGLAVEHLKRAMSSTVGWYAAQRRDWVLSEDPDLDGLRRNSEFKQFEAMYFPSPQRTPLRPPGIHRWEQSRYTNRLLGQAARRWETVWHERRKCPLAATDPHLLIEWCADEVEAWHLVESLAKDYRHWRVRFDLIEKMKQWSTKYGFEPVGEEVPPFVPKDGMQPDQIVAAINRQLNHNETRLRELAIQLAGMSGEIAAGGSNGKGKALQAVQGRGLAQFTSRPAARAARSRLAAIRVQELPQSQLERLQTELRNRDYWHRGAPRLFLSTVCDAHAAMWQRLHEWLDESPCDTPTAGSAFACAISQAARLSDTSGGRWRVAVMERRFQAAHRGSNGATIATRQPPALPLDAMRYRPTSRSGNGAERTA